MPSLKKNIALNYISQAYLSIIGIIILPLYLKYLGSEAYGLISFFTMLQVWFGMLDAGLTPTLTREVARYLLEKKERAQFLAFFFFILSVLVSIGLIVFLAVGSLSSVIANSWLEIYKLDTGVVEYSIIVIGCVIPFRLLVTVLKGVLLGSDHIPWLSASNIVFASLKFPGVFLSFLIFGFDVKTFFIHQLFSSLLEVTLLFYKSFSILEISLKEKVYIKGNIEYLKSKLKFALSISFTTIIWVSLTQSDKLVLSGILSLSEYGYYSLAVLLASAVLVVTSPLGTVLMPNLVRLNESKAKYDYEKLYRTSTTVVAVLGTMVASILFFCSQELIFLWTGDVVTSQKASEVTAIYAIGNLFLCVASFGYYLQYSKGNLRYHVRGNLLFLLTFVPILIFASYKFGMRGAAYSWLIFNLCFLFLWISYVHNKFLDFSFLNWISTCFLRILFPVFTIGFFWEQLLPSNFDAIMTLASHSIVTVITIICSSSEIRKIILSFFVRAGVL